MKYNTKDCDSVRKPQLWNLSERDERRRRESNRGPSVYQPNALPLGRGTSVRIRVGFPFSSKVVSVDTVL